MKRLILAVCMAVAALSANAAEEARNQTLIQQFKETHVCPSTGKMATKGIARSYVCPGYVVDHGIPYCAGQYIGRSIDAMHNLSYQKHDAENSLKKDVDEKLLCDTLRKLTQAGVK